jgi:DNA segregation ATPase FtsK/SpoIIIE, S-DNA-T family
VRLLIDLAKASPVIGVVALVCMVVLNVFLFIGTHDPRDLIWSFTAAADMVRDGVGAAEAALLPTAIAVPAVALAVLHEAGRRGGDLAPGWSAAAKPGEEERGLVVTADGIVVALQNLGISKLDQAFKDKWRPSFHTLPVKDGDGYFAVFSLPMGVTPRMIADRNEVFARNLHRAKTESWPTDAERDKIAPAGHVALWVANPGALDRPAPDWPLLHEGAADVFKGVPAGVSARGDQLDIKIVANNMVAGGIMGVGKSNACRVVMLGAALDPLAELWVHVFAYNGDFDAFAPRLARYDKGAEEAQLMYAMDSLNELYAEVGRREQRISDLGAKKVTRQLAERHPDLRPRLALFSECHELFRSKDYGEEAAELAVNVMRRARKTAIWLGFDTQDARKDAIPPKIVSLVSVNVCFAVKSWRANDGFLGDGSFQAGIRATELRANRDIGRSVTTGVSDAQFELLKWHYIFSDDDTGQDDAAPVIARAMASLAPGTPVAGNSPVEAVISRDLLADLAEVIGRERARVADLPARLRKLAPSWGRYKQLNGAELKRQLDDLGVRTTNTGNVRELDPADLRRAIGEREAGELAVPVSRTAARSPPAGLRLTRPGGLTRLTSAGHGASEGGPEASSKANSPTWGLTREERRMFGFGSRDEHHGEECLDRSGIWWAKPNPMGVGSAGERVIKAAGGGLGSAHEADNNATTHGSKAERNLLAGRGALIKQSGDHVQVSGEGPGRRRR